MNDTIGVVILAGGKGKRMNTTLKNKVVLPLGGKPMILHGVSLLEKLHISPIIVVVGFAKESVMEVLENSDVIFAQQDQQLGTADALACGIKKLPESIENILVIQGDDCALYTQEVITSLIEKHISSQAAVTFLTIQLDNPHGLGRVIRDNKNRVVAIKEEKDATQEEKKITEINPACYMFNVKFLKENLSKIEKSSITGEYYLTTLIDLAISSHERIETVLGENIVWRGINTPEELAQAEHVFASTKN